MNYITNKEVCVIIIMQNAFPLPKVFHRILDKNGAGFLSGSSFFILNFCKAHGTQRVKLTALAVVNFHKKRGEKLQSTNEQVKKHCVKTPAIFL